MGWMMGWWLGLVVLEVFSDRKDSVILRSFAEVIWGLKAELGGAQCLQTHPVMQISFPALFTPYFLSERRMALYSWDSVDYKYHHR